jgi:hypothetical protein
MIINNNNNNEIILFFLYVNNENELYNITKKKEIIYDGVFSQERQLHIIKENQYNSLNFHKLIGTSYFNFDINEEEMNNLFETTNQTNQTNQNNQTNQTNQTNQNFYKRLNIVDTIVFNKSIFKYINSVFYIYKNYFSQNTTKKIILQPKKQTKKITFIN